MMKNIDTTVFGILNIPGNIPVPVIIYCIQNTGTVFEYCDIQLQYCISHLCMFHRIIMISSSTVSSFTKQCVSYFFA